MFLYSEENNYFNLLVDIFISSTTVVGVIFHSVVITGYTVLSFNEVSCLIEPALVYYFHSLGVSAILSILLIGMFLVSSHYPNDQPPSIKHPSQASQSLASNSGDAGDGVVQMTVSSVSRRISTASVPTICGQSPRELESTKWAHETEIYLIQAAYTLLFILHLANLILGTVLVFPLFFSLKLHLGYIIDDSDVVVCYPPLFWFTFLTLLSEYFMGFVFLVAFYQNVIKEVKSFQHELD